MSIYEEQAKKVMVVQYNPNKFPSAVAQLLSELADDGELGVPDNVERAWAGVVDYEEMWPELRNELERQCQENEMIVPAEKGPELTEWAAYLVTWALEALEESSD